MHICRVVLLFSIILSVSMLVAPASADTYTLESSFGTTGSGNGEFNSPYGIAVNDSGCVYVADTYNHRIQVFSAEGAFVTAWGSFGVLDDNFYFPYAVTVNASGAVHVADCNNHKLKLFTPSGTHLDTHPYPQNVRGIAIDGSDQTFCTDQDTETFSAYNETYSQIGTWGSSGSGDGQLWNPTGIEVTATEVFVVDTQNNRVQVFAKNGNFLRKWPSDTAAGGSDGDFSSPHDVAVNTSGFLFVTDTGNDRVEIFTQAGGFVDNFSCPDPCGIAIGPDDRVYVTSRDDCVKVFWITPAPTVTGITPSSATRGSSCVAVTVSGSDFRDGPAVSLNKDGTTISADNVTRISAETITCTFDLSTADAGSWCVRVINDDGKAGVLSAGFSVTHEPPHITAITPGTGTAGDTLSGVMVTGSGFLPSPQVKLHKSGQPYFHAGDVMRINGTHITCSLDLGGAAPGAWDVIVRNTDGKEDTLGTAFTVDEAVDPAPRRTSSGKDGESTTVVACGSDLTPGKNCTLMLHSGPVHEVTLRITTEADSVLVTAKECGMPTSIEQPNGTLYRCTEMTLYRIGDGEVESVWFTFSVPVVWLEGQGLSPSGVSMLRFHDGAWQELPTIVVEEKDGMAWFRATSPGCSLFAIICKADSSGVNTGDVGEGASRDTIAPTAAPAPVPSLTPAEPLPPDPAGSTPAPQSPLAAAPLLSLPLALLLRRHR